MDAKAIAAAQKRRVEMSVKMMSRLYTEAELIELMQTTKPSVVFDLSLYRKAGILKTQVTGRLYQYGTLAPFVNFKADKKRNKQPLDAVKSLAIASWLGFGQLPKLIGIPRTIDADDCKRISELSSQRNYISGNTLSMLADAMGA